MTSDALVAAIPAMIAAFAAWRASKHSSDVKVEIQTNHGKRAGEYLEGAATSEDLKAHSAEDGARFDLVIARLDALEKPATHVDVHVGVPTPAPPSGG